MQGELDDKAMRAKKEQKNNPSLLQFLSSSCSQLEFCSASSYNEE